MRLRLYKGSLWSSLVAIGCLALLRGAPLSPAVSLELLGIGLFASALSVTLWLLAVVTGKRGKEGREDD